MNPLTRGCWARSGATLALLSLAAGHAAALGLGRIAAQSALGEPLRAEIEVTSLSSDEAAGLRVRIAGPDAYRAAGVDYNPILSSARAALQRRPDGRTVLRLLSERAVQEPFVELILDLTWPSGHLVREYTLLIDPPSSPLPLLAAAPEAQTGAASTLPVVPRAPAPTTNLPPVPPGAVARRAPAAPVPRSTDAEPADARGTAGAKSPANSGSTPSSSAGDHYRVRPGDTLARIAERTRGPGVSLDQMLASLYRDNSGAFIDNNINRLRSGVLLKVPSTAEARTLSAEKARQTVQARSADFGAYRRGLAGVAGEARTEAPSRQASGSVEAAVEDRKRAGATSPDRLTLSKDASTVAAVADALASLQRERRDAEARLATLMRSIDDLKALAGQPAAGASSAASAPTVPTTAAAPSLPVLPRSSASEPVASPGRVGLPPALEPPASGAASAVGAASIPGGGLAASVPSARAAAKPLPVEPAPSGGLLSWLLDGNSFALALGALLLTLLLVAGVLRLRRRGGSISAETSFLDSGLKADSFFAASGGQHVDTRLPAGGSMSSGYSLSQLDAGGDVDPVAEADVYLAYGRDLQAEEILKDAMRSDPERLAIRTKLLEVYAKRRDTKGFEVLASQLHGLTEGRGDDWEKAQQLGRTIEADNPLYAPGGAPPRDSADDDEGPHEPLGVHTQPQADRPLAAFDATAPVDIDIDFGAGDESPAGGSAGLPPLAFDASPPSGEVTEVLPVEIMQRPAPATSTTPSASATPSTQVGHDLDFGSLDFDLPTAAAPPPVAPSPAPAPAPAAFDLPMEFDLSGISLDLDPLPTRAAHAPPAVAQAPDPDAIDFFADVAVGDPLQRKLALADELMQLGDSEGARDLLLEVVAAADGELKSRAEGMLARVG